MSGEGVGEKQWVKAVQVSRTISEPTIKYWRRSRKAVTILFLSSVRGDGLAQSILAWQGKRDSSM